MRLGSWLFVEGGLLFAAFVLLGFLVSHRPLLKFDALAADLRGRAIRLALLFTLSGRAPALVVASILSVVAFRVRHISLWIPAVIILAQLFSQIGAEVFKRYFSRTRPDYWLVGLEAGHSYPSGHATTAVVFFVGWAIAVAYSPLVHDAEKSALVCLLAAWAAGIIWSRLALGAHYLSDVAGGMLLGGACLSVFAAVVLHVLGTNAW